MNDDDDHHLLRDRERHALRRTRIFWISIAILAGLPIAALTLAIFAAGTREPMWLLFFLGPTLLWAAFCAHQITRTLKRLPDGLEIPVWLLITLLLAGLNTGIVIGLFYAGCYLIAGSDLRF
jgi:hypothetical protein